MKQHAGKHAPLDNIIGRGRALYDLDEVDE